MMTPAERFRADALWSLAWYFAAMLIAWSVAVVFESRNASFGVMLYAAGLLAGSFSRSWVHCRESKAEQAKAEQKPIAARATSNGAAQFLEKSMSTIIKPTVGRKVWYWPSEYDKSGPGGMQTAVGQPLDATVIAVWGDRMVNLLVIDVAGKPFPKLSTKLLQDGDKLEKDAYGNPVGGFAEWMPHQVKTAAASA